MANSYTLVANNARVRDSIARELERLDRIYDVPVFDRMLVRQDIRDRIIDLANGLIL